MKRIFLFLFMLLISRGAIFTEPVEGLNFYLELNQMMAINLGVEYFFHEDWSFKGALGSSLGGVTTISYNLLGVYHLRDRDRPWQLDLEIGLPLGYLNPWEGAVLDWDERIQNPFYGFLAGMGLRVGRQTRYGLWALRIIPALWWEYQQGAPWKGPEVIPLAALVWDF